MGKNALLFDFIKAYAADEIEDYLEGEICCGCWMREQRSEKGGEQRAGGSGQEEELGGQRSPTRGDGDAGTRREKIRGRKSEIRGQGKNCGLRIADLRRHRAWSMEHGAKNLICFN
jgi:hypothetical protein